MSSSETATPCAPSGDHASLDRAVTVEETGEEGKASLTFHDIGYEVSTHCGKRRKVILESCRYVWWPDALMFNGGAFHAGCDPLRLRVILDYIHPS